MTDNPTLPPAEGPEYTPCACGHIEPDHDINGRWCASDGCECSLYRPVTTADQAALRHLLAQALARHDAVHARYSHGFANHYGVDPETDGFVDAVTAVMGAAADRTTGELASLAVNAANALTDEKRHYEIACQEIARLRATVERVRKLHDALDTETDLATPDDEITRSAAARKIAAALDGWTDPAELRRMAAEARGAQQDQAARPD